MTKKKKNHKNSAILESILLFFRNFIMVKDYVNYYQREAFQRYQNFMKSHNLIVQLMLIDRNIIS